MSRSVAPRNAVSFPHGSFSTFTKCSKCEIIMMELRIVMPNKVTKPTSVPSESEPWPFAKIADQKNRQHAADECER